MTASSDDRPAPKLLEKLRGKLPTRRELARMYCKRNEKRIRALREKKGRGREDGPTPWHLIAEALTAESKYNNAFYQYLCKRWPGASSLPKMLNIRVEDVQQALEHERKERALSVWWGDRLFSEGVVIYKCSGEILETKMDNGRVLFNGKRLTETQLRRQGAEIIEIREIGLE